MREKGRMKKRKKEKSFVLPQELSVSLNPKLYQQLENFFPFLSFEWWKKNTERKTFSSYFYSYSILELVIILIRR